jgi:hypothetical protein
MFAIDVEAFLGDLSGRRDICDYSVFATKSSSVLPVGVLFHDRLPFVHTDPSPRLLDPSCVV